MSDESILQELIEQWERSQQQGEGQTPEEFCRSHPLLLPQFMKRVAALREVDAFLQFPLETSAKSFDGENTPSLSRRGPSSTSNGNFSVLFEYEVRRPHAKGGLGEVLVAYDKTLDREVAIKIIQPPHDLDPKRRRRFLREAEITSRLQTPGIVPVHAIGHDADNRPCYAMRLVEGETLQEAIERVHSIKKGSSFYREGNFRSLLRRLISVCNTIAFAHSNQVIHRDIKPSNILLAGFDETFVVDWGLAKILPSSKPSGISIESIDTAVEIDEGGKTERQPGLGNEALTREGHILGTPAYMSPEQASGKSETIGFATDIYSLGATMYVLLTGRAPIASQLYADAIRQIQIGQFPSPRSLESRIPKGLEAICLKAMALAPNERYASALHLAQDIDHWMSDEPISALRDSLGRKAFRLARRHSAWTVSSFVASLTIAILASVFAVSFNAQKKVAIENRQAAEILSIEKSQLAEQEALAKTKAIEQSNLALHTIWEVADSVQKKLSSVEGAQASQREVLKTILNGLNKVSASFEDQHEVDYQAMRTHERIGMTYLLVGDLAEGNATDKALEHFEKARVMAEEIAASNPDRENAHRSVSIAYERLGDLHLQKLDLTKAKEAYDQSLLVTLKMLEQQPTKKSLLRDVAFGYEKVGDVLFQLDQIEEARENVLKAKRYYSDHLETNPDHPVYLRDQIVVLSKMGRIHLRLEQWDEAAAIYRENLHLLDRLEKNPKAQPLHRDRSVLLNKLGGVLEKQAKMTEALTCFRESLSLAQEISNKNSESAQAQRDLLISLQNVAKLESQTENREDAKKRYQQALEIATILSQKDESNATIKIDLANTHFALGRLEREANRLDLARSHFEIAHELLVPLKASEAIQSLEHRELYEAVVRAFADSRP